MPTTVSSWSRLVAGLALVLGTTADARTLEDEIAVVSVNIDQIAQRSERLESQVAPGRSFISPGQAVQRFQDCVYLHMIGEHEVAAEGFFALVTTAALGDAGLHRDAEWYLAETLFAMGNYGTAEARFQVIAEDDAHPFRPDAVRRLLELYAATGNDEKFDDYYQREIVRGRVAPSDVITYTVAKSFYQQGDLVKAKSYLLEVPVDSPIYRKARYYLGTIMIVEGEIGPALDYFKEVSELSIDTLEDRQILDLSLLAIGRIYYELLDFEQAAEFYGRIGGDSEFLADKLYEIVWTFVKQDDFQEALNAVEIFLLAFPEHEYTAQLKLLEGHLHLQEVQYDSALSSYEQVVIDYTPIRERFSQLSSSAEQGRSYFEKLAAGELGDEEELPPYVDAMMMADEDMAQAIFVYRELQGQERSIQVSEQLIDELSAVLDTATGLGGFDNLRFDARRTRDAAVTEQLALLELEENWLRETTGGDLREQLDRLVTTREALEQAVGDGRAEIEAAVNRLAAHDESMRRLRDQIGRTADSIAALEDELTSVDESLKDSELEDTERGALEKKRSSIEVDLQTARDKLATFTSGGARTEIVSAVDRGETKLQETVDSGVADLRREYRSLRSRSDEAGKGSAFDDMHVQLNQAVLRLESSVSKLSTMESSELERIKARFEHEVQEVASQRVEHRRTLDEAAVVSVALTKSGFGRLEDFFAESVLKADMGIVDVYWSQKLEVADQKERVKEEKQELLEELDQRFRVIKQKLRQ